jgi:hypothetical protein
LTSRTVTRGQLVQAAIKAMRDAAAAFDNPETLITVAQFQKPQISYETKPITPAEARRIVKGCQHGEAHGIKSLSMKINGGEIKSIGDASPNGTCWITHAGAALFKDDVVSIVNDHEPCLTYVATLVHMRFPQADAAIEKAEAAIERLKYIIDNY